MNSGRVIDVHCHLAFARREWGDIDPFPFEVEESSTPSYLSETMMNRPLWRVLRRWFGLKSTDPDSVNGFLEQFLVGKMLESRCVDQFVLLALDEVCDDSGNPLGEAVKGKKRGTHLYTSNSLVRHYCRKYPERFLFGASIHPYRADALERLDAVADEGAVLVKWLACVHNVSASDPRTVAFFEHCARRKVALLLHYGPEYSLGVARPDFFDPADLLATLRTLHAGGRMPTVIIAHAAAPNVWPFQTARYFRSVIEALQGDLAEAPLYCDTAAFGLWGKAHWFEYVLRHPALLEKFVHGSDYPILTTPVRFVHRLGGRYREVVSYRNPLDRDYVLKRELGVPDSVFGRAADLFGSSAEGASRASGAGDL